MKKETDRCEKLLKRGKSKTKLLFFDEWNDVSQWATTRWSVPPSPSPSLLRRAWSKRENRRVCPSKVPKPDFSSNIGRKHIFRTKMRKMCFLFLRFFWEKPWRKSGCASRMRRRSGKGSKSIFWTVRPAICGMEQSTIIRNPSSRFTSESHQIRWSLRCVGKPWQTSIFHWGMTLIWMMFLWEHMREIWKRWCDSLWSVSICPVLKFRFQKPVKPQFRHIPMMNWRNYWKSQMCVSVFSRLTAVGWSSISCFLLVFGKTA